MILKKKRRGNKNSGKDLAERKPKEGRSSGEKSLGKKPAGKRPALKVLETRKSFHIHSLYQSFSQSDVNYVN